MTEPVDVLFTGTCDWCGSAGVMVQAFAGPSDPRIARVLEQLGYRPLRHACEKCSRCSVCDQLVHAGQGAPRTGPFPAVHSKCLSRPEAEAIRMQLRRALSGGKPS